MKIEQLQVNISKNKKVEIHKLLIKKFKSLSFNTYFNIITFLVLDYQNVIA